MISKWSNLLRTVQGIGSHVQALEDVLRNDLIPTLTGRPPPNKAERKLIALPARYGGLGIVDPSLNSEKNLMPHSELPPPLRNLILEQDRVYSSEALADQMTAKYNSRPC